MHTCTTAKTLRLFKALIFTLSDINRLHTFPSLKINLPSSLLLLCHVCHIFKCANIDDARVYLHVYYVTSVRESHSVFR